MAVSLATTIAGNSRSHIVADLIRRDPIDVSHSAMTWLAMPVDEAVAAA